MSTNNQVQIAKDVAKKQITVTRSFNAPVEKVWEAWTCSELLDQWWAPRPWKAVTKEMHFEEGGYWLYAMTGPNGEVQWCKVNYLTIQPTTHFTAQDTFCDEHGVQVETLPHMHWSNTFRPLGNQTSVVVLLQFESEAAMQTIIEMGFEQGFTMALGNLDEMFE